MLRLKGAREELNHDKVRNISEGPTTHFYANKVVSRTRLEPNKTDTDIYSDGHISCPLIPFV